MEIKTNVSYMRSRRCADVYSESAIDYILPDYHSDIRKILFTEATLRPSGRFAGGDDVELSGIIVYNVVYLNAEGDISSVEFTSDYDYSVKCSGDSYRDSIADTRISAYNIRLVGPRKISARASLVGSVRLSESDDRTVTGNAFDSDRSPEICSMPIKVRQSKLSSTVEREYAESLTKLEGAISEEVKVVYAAAEPMVDSVSHVDCGVNVKGKLRMMAVIKNADDVACAVEKLVGFDEIIDFEGISEDMLLSPMISVASLKTSLNADDVGCEAVMSCILEMSVVGESNGRVEVILDGYLRECPTDNGYTDFCYTRLADCATVKGSHNAEIARADLESEGLREIIFLTAAPKVERVECVDGKLTLLGEIRYSGVGAEMVGEGITYTGIKFTSPFAVNADVNCPINEGIKLEHKLSVQGVSTVLDAEKLYASCTLECSVIVCDEQCVRTLSSMNVREGESYTKCGGRVTVYYPTSGDTLFSVAKKFHSSGLKIAADNAIADSVFAADNPSGSLAKVKRLIIY